jgi:hypothetical protein
VTYTPVLDGLVAEIEERDAARFGHYTWMDWLELPYQERVDGVAYHRVSRLVEMHQQEAVSSEMKSKARPMKRSRK